jgi:hypothetical protein
VFFGCVLVVVGVLFLLNNMGYVRAGNVIQYWPALMIGYGLLRIAQAQGGPGLVAGGTWILFGSLFLAENLDFIDIDFGDIWPLILVVLGVFMLWKTTGRPGAARGGQDTNSTVSATAVLGGIERRNNSPDFRGGELTAVMGGCELDLRTASIVSGEAVIDAFALWGGVEVKVPPEWTVVSKIVPILGGFEDTTQPPKDDSKRLVVRGFAIMGGIGVTN